MRRNFMNWAVIPCFAVFAGLSAQTFAQDKPAEKPAKPAQEHKEEVKKAVEAKKDEMKAEAKKAEAVAGKDIVDTAMGDKNCSTLCELLKAGDLIDTLKGEGPFTVFAPSNAAFEKLGKEALEGLKKDKAKLQSVLKYHVAAGNMLAADVTKAKTIKTLNGAEIKVSEKDGKWMLDKSTITATDVKCKNGVVHMIDTVLMPAEKKDH